MVVARYEIDSTVASPAVVFDPSAETEGSSENDRRTRRDNSASTSRARRADKARRSEGSGTVIVLCSYQRNIVRYRAYIADSKHGKSFSDGVSAISIAERFNFNRVWEQTRRMSQRQEIAMPTRAQEPQCMVGIFHGILHRGYWRLQ